MVRYGGLEVTVEKCAPCPTYPGLVRLVIDDGRRLRTVRAGAQDEIEVLEQG